MSERFGCARACARLPIPGGGDVGVNVVFGVWGAKKINSERRGGGSNRRGK